jgi:hypothetical protein
MCLFCVLRRLPESDRCGAAIASFGGRGHERYEACFGSVVSTLEGAIVAIASAR